MTLIRALPSLTDTERPHNASVREQLQRLEDVAREELLELQQLADARPAPPRADDELLGLDGGALK